MKGFIFFSVHEPLFHEIAARLRPRGIDAWSGFVWGRNQVRYLEQRGGGYEPLTVFTRDVLPLADDGRPADVAWLEQRERELGISIRRMLAAERHLLRAREQGQILRLAEVVLREVAAAYDRARPDFVVSEDVSCFCSYAHFAIARERKIPFWAIGTARLPRRVSIYADGLQRSSAVEATYRASRASGLTPAAREAAEGYVREFRERPVRPTGMDVRAVRPGVGRAEVAQFRDLVEAYLADRENPTMTPPPRAVAQRLQRMARIRLADRRGLFEQPVAGEAYVIYPIHFQPEASTLVQAPLYVDQVALIADIARSLPVGHWLYVKEHVSSRGRRAIAYYEAIQAIPGVRLLGPDVDTWGLIRGAAGIAVITGTMGWEGVLFDKPVVTFGDVWFDVLPHVYRARDVPKDQWYELFTRALTRHQPDHDATLALVSAMHACSHPGIMGNPRTFPGVMDESNLAALASALYDAACAGGAP